MMITVLLPTYNERENVAIITFLLVEVFESRYAWIVLYIKYKDIYDIYVSVQGD